MMKKTMIVAVLAAAVSAQAALVNWQSTAPITGLGTGADGWVALMMQDVNGDNGSSWNSAAGQLVIDLAGNVDALATSNATMDDDVMLYMGSVVELFPGSGGFDNWQMSPLASAVAPAGALVYTVIVQNTALAAGDTGGIHDAATFNIGDVNPPALGADYNVNGALTGPLNGVTVIPEPATIGLMGIAGLGMFLARRKARR